MVEMEVEAVRIEIGLMGASTSMMGYSTEVVEEHMDAMIIGMLGMVMRCIRLGRSFGPWRMSRTTPRGNGFILFGIVI